MASKNKQDCQSCEAESYTRNNYFTGKLMVERDFTDEQHYFMEKIRLHHQRLHGSGVVCGLQITAHDEPCDDRYVVLQPGSAVDCCGKDILVTEPEIIDLYAFPEIQALLEAQNADPDNPDLDTNHRLQLCIQYRECPGEDIPVLYDECGCDDTQCAPNRILESYEIQLRLDQAPAAATLYQPGLDWASTINVAHAEQVYLHEATNRLYIMTADDAGLLYQISTDNFSVEASYALGRRGLALTTNENGDELYVVVANAGGIAAGYAELWVFDVNGTDLANGSVRDGVIANSDNSAASLLRLADGRVAALLHSGGRLRLWDAGIADPTAPANTLDYGTDLYGLSVGSASALLYSAEPAGTQVHQFDMDVANFSPQVLNGTTNPATERVTQVNVVMSSGSDLLLVLDNVNQQLRLIDPSAGGSVMGTVALAHAPLDVAISQGAHWAYVLVADGDDSYLQTINLHLLMQGNMVNASAPVAVGDASQALALSSSGQRLFASYVDDLSIDNAGGVAVIDISETQCEDLLWAEDCPDCDSSDCLILTTIENYRPGFRVLDMTDPASDPLDDVSNSIARLNNTLERKRLPSTEAITNALACVLENCCGSSQAGEQGPPGLPGTPGADGADGQDGQDGQDGTDGVDGANGQDGQDGEDGRSINDVDVEMVPCDQDPSGAVIEEGDGLRLSLQIPGNCNPDLAHICNINWWHNGDYTGATMAEQNMFETINDRNYMRFVIRFDRPVRAIDLNEHSVRVFIRQANNVAYQLFQLNAFIVPVTYTSPVCEINGYTRMDVTPNNFADGTLIYLDTTTLSAFAQRGFVLRFSVHGDFIRDEEERGADLDHLPLWLTSQDPAQPTAEHTGNGVPGGEFISWLNFRNSNPAVGSAAGEFARMPTSMIDNETFNRLDSDADFAAESVRNMLSDAVRINLATASELMTLSGIGPELAEAIIRARDEEPIRDESSLRRVPGIGNSLMDRIRNHILFDDGE